MLRLRPLAFATFLVWRLRIGACGFWRLWQLPNIGVQKDLTKKTNTKKTAARKKMFLHVLKNNKKKKKTNKKQAWYQKMCLWWSSVGNEGGKHA